MVPPPLQRLRAIHYSPRRPKAAGYGKLGYALRLAIVEMHFDHDWSASDIHSQLTFSRTLQFVSLRTVQRILARYKETGLVTLPSEGRRRRPGKMTRAEWDFLHRTLLAQPDLYLDEMKLLIKGFSRRTLSTATILRTLQRKNFTNKVLKRMARDRNLREERRFVELYKQYDPEYFVFADETRKELNVLQRRKGWAPRGKRVQIRVGPRGRSYSATAILTLDGIIDHFVTQSTGVTADDFVVVLGRRILPHMRPFPDKCSMLFLDNAAIHHDPRVKAMCERAQIKLIYIPPYCNDRNPIEMAFSKVKAHLERHRAYASAEPRDALVEALESVDCFDARGFFAKSGYNVPDWIVEGLLF